MRLRSRDAPAVGAEDDGAGCCGRVCEREPRECIRVALSMPVYRLPCAPARAICCLVLLLGELLCADELPLRAGWALSVLLGSECVSGWCDCGHPERVP